MEVHTSICIGISIHSGISINIGVSFIMQIMRFLPVMKGLHLKTMQDMPVRQDRKDIQNIQGIPVVMICRLLAWLNSR